MPSDDHRNPRFQHFPDDSCLQAIDHPSHARPGVHPFPDRLYVVTMLENPLRWRSRYHNFSAFEAMVMKSSAELYVAEVAFGDRHFEVTAPDNPRHLQLRSYSEVWRKENALNILISRLPPEANYIAWLDADIEFVRPDWAQETLQLLQHYKFLQMFSHGQDLGPDYEPLNTTPGYVYDFFQRTLQPHHRDFGRARASDRNGPGLQWRRPRPCSGYGYGGGGLWMHPGFAWAARKSALNEIGGLIDWAILGSGDWHLATCLMGEVERSLYEGYDKQYRYSEAYKRQCRQVQWRCEKYIRRNVGYLPGTVHHYFHGKKKDRNYDQRWKFLALSQFDPEKDLKRDHQGLLQLEDDGSPRSLILRDGIRQYARSRQEDGFYY